jgi:hypothetical protein
MEARLMQNGNTGCYCPIGPCGVWRQCWSTSSSRPSRLREEDDTVHLMDVNALADFEIADYLYVPEFGKLNMLGDATKLLDESFVTAANLEGHW